MNTIASRLVALCVVLACSASASEGPYEKPVGADWTWFTDYAYWSSQWTLNVEAGCEVELGAGIMAFRSPRGGIHRFKSYYRFTAYGIGAIHVRVVSGKRPCRVRLDMGNVSAIPIYGDPSVVRGAVDDVKRVRKDQRERGENRIPE